MILIYIVAFIAVATIVSTLVWFAVQNTDIVCNSNGCTNNCSQGRTCTCGWPGTTEQCQPDCPQFKQ